MRSGITSRLFWLGQTPYTGRKGATGSRLFAVPSFIPPLPFSERAEKPKWWRAWLPHLGGLVAVTLLVGSLLTFTIKLSSDVYRGLTWKESIDVISFSSLGPQVFLNSGDGEIFVSHVDIKGNVISEIVYINSIVKPKQFLSIPINEQTLKEHGGKEVLQTSSNEEWQDIIDNKIRRVRDPSYVAAVFSSDSPILNLYKTNLNQRLRTFAATATIVYYFSYRKEAITKNIPVEGIVLKKP
jgi:hypothetical protein